MSYPSSGRIEVAPQGQPNMPGFHLLLSQLDGLCAELVDLRELAHQVSEGILGSEPDISEADKPRPEPTVLLDNLNYKVKTSLELVAQCKYKLIRVRRELG